MTDQTKVNGSPRHAGPTREMPLVGYTPRHNAGPRPANRNAAANGANVFTWPTQAGSPTKALLQPVAPKPRPFVPSPTVEPPMTKADASTMHNLCLYGAIAVAAAGVVALIVGVLT